MVLIKHRKTNTVPDWTQTDLDAVIAGGAAPLPPSGTLISEITVPSDWNDDHELTGTIPATNLEAAGSDTQIQYNNAGAFGASSGLTWNNATSTLTSAKVVVPFTSTGVERYVNSAFANFGREFGMYVEASGNEGGFKANSVFNLKSNGVAFSFNSVATTFFISSPSLNTTRLQDGGTATGIELSGLGTAALVKLLTNVGGTFSGLECGATIARAQTASAIPLIARGAASQTANFQEWQDSAGTPLAVVTAAGSFAIGHANPTSRLHVQSAVSGATLQGRFENTSGGQPAGFRMSNGGWDICFQTNPGNGWFEIADAAGNIQHRWDAKSYLLASDGSLGFSSQGNYATGGVGARDVAITRSSAGVIEINNGTAGQWRSLRIGAATSSTVALVARGAASQTSDLQQWQDSASNLLVSVSASGVFTAQGNIVANSGNILIYDIPNDDYATFSVSDGESTIDRTLNVVGQLNSSGANLTGALTMTGNGLMGNLIPVATATPRLFSFGGTYGNSIPGSASNLKWMLYQDGTANNAYGIGMSGGLMEMRAGAGGEIGFFTNGSTTERMRITASGNFGFGVAAPATFMHARLPSTAAAGFFVDSLAPSAITAIIRGAASQTANIFELQNSAGSNLFSVDANARVIIGTSASRIDFVNGGNFMSRNITNGAITMQCQNFTGASWIVSNLTANAATVPLVVQGASGQTADLQQWQNSAGTVLARVKSTGVLNLPAYTVATLPTGVQGDRCYVTDALAPVFLTALTGGGAVRCPAFHNGTTWVAG